MDHFAVFDAPDLAPIVASEVTSLGWRGLAEDGVVFDVKGSQAAPARIPDDKLCITNRDGRPTGYRAVARPTQPGTIDRYLEALSGALALTRANDPASALTAIDIAIDAVPTVAARFNRAMILLALGRWTEGLREYDACERQQPFERPISRMAREHGIRRWQGEDIAGKRLLLIHDHGFGDTIMTLRYVPRLQAMGAEVVILVPRELERLAAQFAPTETMLVPADYFCPMLLLLHMLEQTPWQISAEPYLRVDPAWSDKWRDVQGDRTTIGIAWSVGVRYDGDFPRSAPLEGFVDHFGGVAELVSIQQQGGADARALGVKAFEFEFDDFADCAGLISCLDQVVTIDTAALHLAGAIGHPNVTGLLSHWHSWRWLAPLYSNLKLCRQDAPGDWASAFAQARAR